MAGRASATGAGVRLAELVASVSLATDLGAGNPLEHALRTCVLAVRLAEAAGLDDAVRADAYDVSLLRSIGCTADAHEQAALFGDELAARAELNLAAHLSPLELASVIARRSGAGAPPVRRARALVAVLAAGPRLQQRIFAAHCEAADRLGSRLGLHDSARAALLQVFERWDGGGYPAGIAGEAIAPAARLVQLAYDAALLTLRRDADAARQAVARGAGTLFDPALAEVYARTVAVSTAAEVAAPWEEVIAHAPTARPLGEDELDLACRAIGEFADLKSPWLLGHSAGVAELAEAAAWRLRLAADDVATVRRAGHLHDLGRVGVPSGVWDRPGRLTSADWEAVRLHPYHAERAFSRSPALAPLGALAGAHHERLDGSGYHRGSPGSQQGTAARILAAADVYRAMTEARPHRAALTADRAEAELREEVRAGRLDGEAAAAVLAAAGRGGAARRREWPAGMSEREVEVLRLVARGRSNREIADALVISPKTVGHHVQHVYAKARVSTRAGAALFAMEHGLLRE